MVENTLKSIKEFIRSYIETYQSSLNTTNPDFISELYKFSNVIQDMFELTTMTNKKGLSNEEFAKAEKERTKQLFKQILSGLSDLDHTMETSKLVRLHRNLTRCYFEFMRKNVRDFVPKRIIHKLVKHVVNNIDRCMHELVFTPYVVNRSFDQVLVEVESVVDDRNRAVQMLNAVNKALKNMEDVQYI